MKILEEILDWRFKDTYCTMSIRMEHIDTIFNRHNTDKNPSFHNYSRQYNTLFKEYRDKPLKYLEIGVFRGGSIKAMREVFPNATCILGLDID